MFFQRIGNKYVVPTELKEGGLSNSYKHIVPTGLNMRQLQLPKEWITLLIIMETIQNRR